MSRDKNHISKCKTIFFIVYVFGNVGNGIKNIYSLVYMKEHVINNLEQFKDVFITNINILIATEVSY